MTMDYYESDSPPPGVAEGESLTVEQAIANLHSKITVSGIMLLGGLVDLESRNRQLLPL